MNTKEIQYIAFDLFGTVFDLSAVPRQEIKDYIAHVRKPDWSPLTLPDSWLDLPLHPDSLEGIHSLAVRGFALVSCSNAPYDFTLGLFERSGLDKYLAITDIAEDRCYKPAPAAYLAICKQFGPEPSEVLMVTGNEGSPDVEGARAVGMQSVLIRQPGTPQTIIELAKAMGPPRE